MGATTLSRALASLPPSVRGEGRSDIVTGLGDDAAVLRPFFQAGGRGEGNGSGGGMVQVQTVDFFKTFSPGFDPFLFGQIAGMYRACRTCVLNWSVPPLDETQLSPPDLISPSINQPKPTYTEQRTTPSRTATP